MKILLIGSTGYVGKVFKKTLLKEKIPFLVEKDIIDREDPLLSQVELKKYCKKEKVYFILNAAGYTGKPNGDACEKNHEETLRGNVELPQLISAVCRELHIEGGHVSSGCLWGFTGTGKGKIYDESSQPHARFGQKSKYSFYSASKQLGESMINSSGANMYIWRLRLPFDNIDSPRNYLSKLMTYDKLLNVTNSVSHLQDFVDACIYLFKMRCPIGTYI